ncbi:MAG: Methyltransferase domain [Phormidesmis priestleyi Ana]|uniref:Methyltransferase domain n=1 Tax=Phormidesmis priestleyi Ana TaxID=1666911 RepID=A0A0P7ZUJ2_9CYAN|nr:MAG: Methyltransferase domain [Phormidesmis priestleyi Ana]
MNAVASSVINGLLSVKPLAKFAKNRARTMMMDRAETLGIYWRDEARALRMRAAASTPLDLRQAEGCEVNAIWEADLKQIENPDLVYPRYYTTSFHAYDEGNLGWLPASEVDVAARAVHARIWPEGDDRAGVNGDASLRASYHQVIAQTLPVAPETIVDLGAGVGRSTFTLQDTFVNAQVTGVDLSPYFLAIAQYTQSQERQDTPPIQWIHAAAEHTGLPANSVDLVSACLMFHELPTSAAREIIAEAYRLVRPGGHFAIMDMNPQSEVYRKMPPYVLTLLKSTEPYLDQYFALDISEAFESVGFTTPTITQNTPRHRSIIGKKKA